MSPKLAKPFLGMLCGMSVSSKTSTGVSLNDLLATGIPDLVRLLDVLLEWHVGPASFVGDVSQLLEGIDHSQMNHYCH